MTGPTREEVDEWARDADPSYPVLGILHTVEDLQRFASIAIANGVQLHPLREAASAVVRALNDPTLDVPIATAAKIGQQVAALERALAFAAGSRSDARDAARYRRFRSATMDERRRFEHYSDTALDVVLDAAMGGPDA